MAMLEFLRLNWLWMLSFATCLIGVCTWVYVHIRALQLGVQALLRAQMIDIYDRYKDVGVVPLNMKDNFENLWVQYEKLGKNGVMSSIHAEFMAMPTKVME